MMITVLCQPNPMAETRKGMEGWGEHRWKDGNCAPFLILWLLVSLSEALPISHTHITSSKTQARASSSNICTLFTSFNIWAQLTSLLSAFWVFVFLKSWGDKKIFFSLLLGLMEICKPRKLLEGKGRLNCFPTYTKPPGLKWYASFLQIEYACPHSLLSDHVSFALVYLWLV